jgi:uncharacterized phage protein gp47/JayE
MSDYGVTNEGFNRKRLDLLLSELNDEVKSIFGDNFNVSPESPDGQVNGVISESNANLWEIAEESYNAFNPSAATGVTLSNLVQLNGITRLPAFASLVQLSVTGTVGLTIPAGSLVSTSDTGDQFATDIDVILDGSGEGLVFASATVTGPIIALAGTITEIDTPITGWDTVSNALDAITGTNEETDVELRGRRERSVARDAQAIIDAIYAGVANTTGVTQVTVLENDTNITDINGLPPHSFNVIVLGGTDEDIGDIIWLKKPAGILSFGTTTVEISDSQGIPHDISFSRPTTIDIYVEVDITTFDDYPATGDDLIKQAIVDYANGELVEGRGFSLSDDVIYTRLYTPINSVEGHEIDAIRIGTSPSPTGTVNIPVGVDEISRFLTINIVVNS